MADLYQVIMVFPCLAVMAEPVFHVAAMPLLGIEPMVLYPPSPSPCFRQPFYCPLRCWQVRQEMEQLPLLTALPGLYEIYLISFIRDPCHIVMPDRLFCVFFFPVLPFAAALYHIFLLLAVLLQPAQLPIFFIYAGDAPLLEAQQVPTARLSLHFSKNGPHA